MLLNEFLQTRNISTVQTGGSTITPQVPKVNEQGNSFADELKAQLEAEGGVQFSSHAIKRLESRSIDVSAADQLERLNKGVEMAAEKGSKESLILVDSTAYIVSVENNKVITTLTTDDLKGNVFTNIDATVII